MAKKKIAIEWHLDASNQFQEILEYLFSESQNAGNIVGNSILDTIENLAFYPDAHPKDRFKKNNNGNYRACVVYNYRISYYVEIKTIFILRIRHTSREPIEY